jgi:hypothetical protein
MQQDQLSIHSAGASATAWNMLQRGAVAAHRARSAAPLRIRSGRSHHAGQPSAAGPWEQPLAAARQRAASARRAASAWRRGWTDPTAMHCEWRYSQLEAHRDVGRRPVKEAMSILQGGEAGGGAR